MWLQQSQHSLRMKTVEGGRCYLPLCLILCSESCYCPHQFCVSSRPRVVRQGPRLRKVLPSSRTYGMPNHTFFFFRKDVFILNSGNCFVVGILVAMSFQFPSNGGRGACFSGLILTVTPCCSVRVCTDFCCSVRVYNQCNP